MPVISFQVPDFLKLYGQKIDTDTLTATLPMLGGDLDGVDGETVHIEYFPDRPDLVSVEGIARAMRAFKGVKPGLAKYRLAKPDGRLVVDPSVANVRPYIVMCKVEGIGPIDDEGLRSLMDFQEKLAYGIGRRRRRVAIGIHDAADVEGPYRYTTAKSDYRFFPLQGDREMTIREILTEHPKGRDYAHLLPANGPYPVIEDRNGNLLSLPPVINGTHTELREGTQDLILDLTGPDLGAIHTAMAILVTAFAERGAKIIPFEVKYPKTDKARGKTLVSPDLSPRKGTVRVSETDRVLGFGLNASQIVKCLKRLGHDAKADPKKKDLVHVESPAWRADLLHEWDLIEDVAKGFGFANVVDDMPKAITFGSTHPTMQRAQTARTSMIGHGYLEATTLTISNERDQYDHFDVPQPEGRDAPVRVANPITEDHTLMRTWLTPSLFGLLAANKHRDYPQALFEVGQVVENKPGNHNNWRLAALRADVKAGFTQVKSLATTVLADLGVDARLEEDDHPAFIAGRVARIIDTEGKVLGRFGEFHPRVLERYEIRVPVSGFEFDLDALLPLSA